MLLSRKTVLDTLAAVHVDPEVLIRQVMFAVGSNPNLLRCTDMSLLRAAFQAGQMGLDPSGTLGQGWIVPFNRKDGTIEAVFMPGWRGLVQIAYEGGEVTRIDAHPVYEKDIFELALGDEPHVNHRPSLEAERGAMIGAYAVILQENGSKIIEWMAAADIEKARAQSSAPNSLMWAEFTGEGYRKTVLRRALKRVNISEKRSPHLVRALAAEERTDQGDTPYLPGSLPVNLEEEGTAVAPPPSIESLPPLVEQWLKDVHRMEYELEKGQKTAADFTGLRKRFDSEHPASDPAFTALRQAVEPLFEKVGANLK